MHITTALTDQIVPRLTQGKELVVDEHSACLQGIPRQGLPSDHFQLNRFTAPDDPCYVAVRNQILQFYNEELGKHEGAATCECLINRIDQVKWLTLFQ